MSLGKPAISGTRSTGANKLSYFWVSCKNSDQVEKWKIKFRFDSQSLAFPRISSSCETQTNHTFSS